MAQRNFSNNAVQTQLVVPVDDTAGSFVVSSVSGFPAPPFTILIDPDDPSEEACLVTFIAGTTLTVTRGYDSTVALPHASGAVVKHAAVAVDFREANLHVNAVDAVHGVLGDIVGTSDSQTLTNKAISGSNNTITDIAQDSVTGLDDSLALKANLAGGNTFTGPQVLPADTTIGSVSGTELSYVDGATSNIQGQIDTLGTLVNTKAPINNPTFTGNVTLPSSTTIGTVTAGEIAALDGVIGNLQSQISGITGGGVAVPPGGNTNDILVKLSDLDYEMAWKPLSELLFVPGTGNVSIYPDLSLTSTDHDATGTFSIGGQTFRYYQFTTTGLTQSLTATNWTSDGVTGVVGKLLVVAGGGGGGGYSQSSGDTAGAGGAGGLWYGDYAFGIGTHNLTVGAGGAAGLGAGVFGDAGNGGNGQPSWIDHDVSSGTGGVYCYGGGGGRGVVWSGGGTGLDGGSGGGGFNGGAGGNPIAAGYGFAGGTSQVDKGGYGGGAGGAGSIGGPGMNLNLTGTSIEYAKGGVPGSAAAGTAARGNGGGTTEYGTSSGPGFAGGSGTVIAMYRIA